MNGTVSRIRFQVLSILNRSGHLRRILIKEIPIFKAIKSMTNIIDIAHSRYLNG